MTVTTVQRLMTPEKTILVQRTWQKLAPLADTAARLFYNRLFEIDPPLRAMFDGVEMKGQGRKVIQALAMVVNGLDRADEFLPVIEALGRRHAAYGVSDAHYDTVGAALIWTLEKGLGDAWSEEVAAAWTEAYLLVANAMRAAGNEAIAARSLESTTSHRAG